MVAFYKSYDEGGAGVLGDDGFAQLHAGLLEGGYDLGDAPETLAAMDLDGDGAVSFRDFIDWFQGLMRASELEGGA